MNKTTPGPWTHKGRPFLSPLFEGEYPKFKNYADVQLIAAAPDLLEACRRALLGFENTPPVNNEDRYEPMMVLIAAIAKAEGKS